MKKLIFILFFTQTIFAQKFITRNGVTGFKASVEIFEPVKAENNSTTAILTSDGRIASQLFISAFKFKVALMQEHFNESYMESDKFPKATFKGEIAAFNITEINTSIKYNIKGVLTIREISKEISFPVSITPIGDTINLKGEFSILPSDFNIEIPSLVRKKIADKINITINYAFIQKK